MSEERAAVASVTAISAYAITWLCIATFTALFWIIALPFRIARRHRAARKAAEAEGAVR